MNNTDKLLKSTKISILATVIMLLNIFIWLLGAFYNEQLIGLAFATWYPAVAISLYLLFVLLPSVEIEELLNE